ncbi:transcriptional repressor [Pectobacteriaceae bacterium CE90]|nr:transcriptional repressor [Pectobacteriaceae bacterium CE90]
MACNDNSKFIDLITSFGDKSTSTSKQPRRSNVVVSNPKGNESQSPHIQRLEASHLRATFPRISILDTLNQAAPHCLGASQLYRILNARPSEHLTQATIYRVLNDLWVAGLLIRTDGVRGRATYALKPYKKSRDQDSLRCKCGEKLIFIEDPKLHEHLLSLAGQEGFELDSEPVFTVTIVCAGCPR